MDPNLTDEEKLAEIKKWWRNNGGSIITGIVLGLAVLFGTKAWFSYQEKTAQQASNLYAVLMNAMQADNSAVVAEKTGVLISEYGDTPYATLAALALAHEKIESGELTAAQVQLEWVLERNQTGVMQDTARLRLARVLIAQENLDGAETLLDMATKGTAFDPLYTEVRGDVSVARGDIAAANRSYKEALAATVAGSPARHLLELKYRSTQVASADSGE